MPQTEKDVAVSLVVSSVLYRLIQSCAQMVGLSVEEFMRSAVADKMQELLET